MSNDLHARLASVGIEPCGDNSCIFGRRGGMGTNGGCRCIDRAHDEHRLDRMIRAMAKVLREYATLPARPAAEIERLVDALVCDAYAEGWEAANDEGGNDKPSTKATRETNDAKAALLAALATPAAEIEIDRSPIISAAETYGRALAARRDSRDFDRFYAALLEHEEEVRALATPAPVPADLRALLLRLVADDDAEADMVESAGAVAAWTRANLPPLATGGA